MKGWLTTVDEAACLPLDLNVAHFFNHFLAGDDVPPESRAHHAHCLGKTTTVYTCLLDDKTYKAASVHYECQITTNPDTANAHVHDHLGIGIWCPWYGQDACYRHST